MAGFNLIFPLVIYRVLLNISVVILWYVLLISTMRLAVSVSTPQLARASSMVCGGAKTIVFVFSFLLLLARRQLGVVKSVIIKIFSWIKPVLWSPPKDFWSRIFFSFIGVIFCYQWFHWSDSNNYKISIQFDRSSCSCLMMLISVSMV